MSESTSGLQLENESLKQENAIKSDLISVSAHQLRTSLSAMKWILKMFLDGDFGELTPEQKNFMAKAFESDERMIKLVNEMLSINHAEDTLESATLSAVDIVKVIEGLVFDFTGELYKRGIELIFPKPEHVISPIQADEEKIRVVFQNLIENAIKYSNTGGKIFVNVMEKNSLVDVSIRDTGIGIAPEEADKIFGKFFRAENAKKQDSVGSGLGLYTTKRIVEKHNGTIRFESTAGGGTTFFVELPKSPEASAASATAKEDL